MPRRPLDIGWRTPILNLETRLEPDVPVRGQYVVALANIKSGTVTNTAIESTKLLRYGLRQDMKGSQ